MRRRSKEDIFGDICRKMFTKIIGIINAMICYHCSGSYPANFDRKRDVNNDESLWKRVFGALDTWARL